MRKTRFKAPGSLVMIGLLIFQPMASWGAPTKESRTIGLRYGDIEFYYEDCSEVKKAALRGETDSKSSSRCGGMAPLHAAVVFNLEMVPVLLQSGADINARATGGSTPLHLAVHTGRYESALLLLNRGADALAVTDRGGTALQMLYMTGESTDFSDVTREDVAKSLIAAGVDIDAGDMEGVTPLHAAALAVNGGIKELLALGARADVRDKEGVPVEFYAAYKGDTVGAEMVRVAAGDPVDFTLADGTDKDEWVVGARKSFDASGSPFMPTEIKEPVPSGLSHHEGHWDWDRYESCTETCQDGLDFRLAGCGIVGGLAIVGGTFMPAILAGAALCAAHARSWYNSCLNDCWDDYTGE